jgi:uncharacterized lipoprotein YddW (UPF0748 family)
MVAQPAPAEPASPAAATPLPYKPSEMRGVWLGFHGEPTWQATMASLQANGFNAAFPWMASPGGAFYRSRYLPVAPAVETDGDYLADAVAWGRRHGIEVHARLLGLFLYLGPPGAKDRYAAEGRLMVNADGKPVPAWLCPSKPVNRHLIINAARELAAGYDMDGIQLDYLRYPWSDACYCESCRYLFQEAVGEQITDWPAGVRTGRYAQRFADWRREQITSLLAAVREQVLAIRPGLRISAAVFVDWEKHRDSFGQDCRAWIERGLVDFVVPMDYTDDEATLTEWVGRQVAWAGNAVPLYVGLGPMADNVSLTPEQVRRQVRLGRELGADGFVLFKYTEALAAQYLPVLQMDGGPAPVPTPHAGPRVAFTIGPAEEVQGRRVYREGERVSVAATIALQGDPAMPAAHVEGQLSLFTAAGGLLEDLRAVNADGDDTVQCTVKLPAGRYRFAVWGRALSADGRELPFARWSPVVEVWTAADVAAAAREAGQAAQ